MPIGAEVLLNRKVRVELPSGAIEEMSLVTALRLIHALMKAVLPEPPERSPLGDE